VQQTNHSLITTRTPPRNKAGEEGHTSTKTQATDNPNTEEPIQEKNASATRDPRADELIDSTKKPNEYIRQKPLM